MAQTYQRIDRISEEVRREVDRIIRDELHDPRIDGTFSITRADVTRDLRYAKIYVSVLEDDKRAPFLAACKSAAGYIRRALGKEMIIRTAPELIFVEDNNIAYGVHIAKVLRDVQATEHHEEEEETENAGDDSEE
ncbi:MAG: 30S ribosome-binding factor RbfA [Clostridia bacterium]|nr:30S ribosome-binding factor RbfA [Clostridia bacterium]